MYNKVTIIPHPLKYILVGVVLTALFYQFFGTPLIILEHGLIWYPIWTSTSVNSKIDYNVKNIDWIFDSSLSQTDVRLVELTKKRFLEPPSKKPYNLTYPLGDPAAEEKQHLKALKILKEMKNGFFIECGANNGEFISSTLVLERDYGWNGLLIEADPYMYSSLLEKNRKAWSSPACLSVVPHPQKVTFVHSVNSLWTGLTSHQIPSKYVVPLSDNNTEIINATCLPLFTLLTALNVRVVDYFALDVEGSELKILKTIPFESVLIKIFTIEYPWIPEGEQALHDFMKSKGYIMLSRMSEGNIADIMFIHPSLKENIDLIKLDS